VYRLAQVRQPGRIDCVVSRDWSMASR
jgi:hypothetical protein